MTAEIAILNRSALALAADSAVTISVGNKTKVYDTAEKLFELSKRQPIAIMIYNNVEYVGVPLDVIIRKFRSEIANTKSYKRLPDIAHEFLLYLQNFPHDVFEEQTYLRAIIREVLYNLNEQLNKELRTRLTLFAKSSDPKDLGDADQLFRSIVVEAEKIEKSRPLKGYLSGIKLAEFRSRFSEVIQQAVKAEVKAIEITQRTGQAIERLAFHLMKSERPSDAITGLVFGGFGSDDIFPTLYSIEIDGVFFGEIKVISRSEVDIDRMKSRAAVVPFAQKEMVERFVDGMDSELEDNIESFVSKAFDQALATLTDDIDAHVAVREGVTKNLRQMIRRLKRSSSQDLLDAVYFMSKKELADIAYALVELTSHKRRFSTDEQTVGGPIDVAVLTKSEGLVWIRRKHYFTTDVNQGFVARVNDRRETGDEREEVAR